MNPYLIAWIAVFGLIIGSFLNVVIYRLPRGTMFESARSKCPNCRKLLRWYHNIPLLSWLALRGRCAFCNSPISPRYPFVEFSTALLYVVMHFLFGFGWTFWIAITLTSILVAIIFIDIDFQIIPDVLTLPGALLGLAASFVPEGIGIMQSAIGLLVGGGSLYLVAELGDRIFKKESMGGGDIKMGAMLGAFLGWQQVLFVFFAAALVGLVVSVAVLAMSPEFRKSRVIPFGPFLSIAGLLSLTFGSTIIHWYLQFSGFR